MQVKKCLIEDWLTGCMKMVKNKRIGHKSLMKVEMSGHINLIGLHIRYSPVTTSQTHALPRISTRGYTQKAAVCHA